MGGIMNEIEKEFLDIKKQIKEKGYDYQSILDSGDILIPEIILRNEKLSANEKFYLSIYYMYGKDINKADVEMLKVLNINGLKRIKKNLSRLKYIKKVKLDYVQAKEKTIEMVGKGEECEWCKKRSYILHEHHYPILRKDGGKEIVKICPNCHSLYHYLLETDIYE
jgi:hypothetical protein